MEFLVRKHTGKDQKEESHWIKIEKLTPISINRDLILVKEGKVSIKELGDAEKECDSYEYYPILFIATASTKIAENLTVAQFVGEYGGINTRVISELPNNYYQDDNYYLVDYQGYQNMCKLTGENTLSLGTQNK